jgi:hypothetical protein
VAGYGTDELFEAWLSANGFTLPETAPAPAILRQRGSDYVDGLYGASLPGEPTAGIDQERAFPRIGATAYRKPIPDDAIPLRWIHASYAAAWYEANNPGGLQVSATASGAVKREKIDVIETEYFAGSGDVAADATVRLSAVEGLVAPFLIQSAASGPAIWAIG